MSIRLGIALSSDDDVEDLDEPVADEPVIDEPKTDTHDVFVKALQTAGFSVVSNPGKVGKTIVVSLGDEKEFIDAIAEKLQVRFDKLGDTLKDIGGGVDLVQGKGDKTIKFWGSITVDGKPFNIDFTYRVGQGTVRVARG
jgi:hypothetical protein